MKKILNENVSRYVEKNPVRLHMPGHKGRSAGENDYYYKDITELSSYSDNLLSPKDVILSLNQYIKEIFKSKKSFICVNGSTGGLEISLLYSLKSKDKVILPRNSHIANYYGISLADGQPIYIYPSDIVRGIKEDEYVEAVKKNKDAKAIVITYPTYFGYSIDIKNLCERIKRINNDIIIIVDEAHGAHFLFNREYPCCAMDAKSDIVITSMHKTLTGLTQTSLIHINSDLIDLKKFEVYFKMMTSTSPSYLFLQSVEEAVHFAVENGEEILDNIKTWYFETKEIIEGNTDFILEEFDSDCHDYAKICINTVNSDIDGYTLEKLLEKDYNIFTECSTSLYTLCYLGLKSNHEDVKLLQDALLDIQKRKISLDKKEEIVFGSESNPEIKYSMRNTLDFQRESVLLEESIGKTSYGFIVPYPPGYPLVTPGEVINKNIYEYLNKIKNKQIVLGLNDGFVDIVKEK